MAEALIFHYRHQERLLNRANPLIKFLSVIAICVTLFSLTLKGLLLLVTSLSFVMALQRLPILRYRHELRYFAIILILILVTEYLALRSISLSLVAALRFLAIIQCGLLLTDCTAADDLARSIGSTLNRIPKLDGWAVASTVELTLSLLPMVFDASLEVVTARKARLERRRNPIKAIFDTATSIFSLILDKAEDLSLALEGRHYDPSQARKRLPYTLVDLILIILVTALLIGAKVL
ncbi:MAG: energy-coupling factor transporter transmembrane protein EcfT [Spirochaetales bacterium]|nr:energy-coupling factor transporter transmembrane protein EcfT [Spirochaetales bacterium]